MSENKTPKEECEAKGGTYNAETGTCTMPEAESKASDLNLTSRIESVIKDVLDAKIKALELEMDNKIDSLLKAKEVEMEQALRKGFGLENDPVVHKSDLISAIRKAALETTENKRSPKAETKGGPDGNKAASDPYDMFDFKGEN